MGIHMDLVNFNELFQKKAIEPVIINDYAEATEAQRDRLNQLIYSCYSGDVLNNMPTCECGNTIGEYNVGVVCPDCGKPVVPKLEQELEPIVWARKPDGVLALINPMVWLMLDARFSKSGFNIIRWICDRTYRPAVKQPPTVREVEEFMAANGLRRGLNSFVANFDLFMTTLFNMKSLKPNNPVKSRQLQKLLATRRDCVFCDYLPLPNRAMLIVEDGNMGKWVDPLVTVAVNGIRMMAGIDTEVIPTTTAVKENRTVKAIATLAEFYEGFYRTTLAKKTGIFRKNVFGSRAHWSFRAVITSLTGDHHYDEIHIPWGIGVSVFRIHLMNKLLRIGWTVRMANKLLNEYAMRYHPLLDALFKELIAQTPYRGIPAVMQRNPSLERASAQSVYITKVKSAVEQPSVSNSILCVKGMNADYDGDQINFTLALDNRIAEYQKRLSPHMSILELKTPRKISGNASIPKPVAWTMSNWLKYGPVDEVDPVKWEKMRQLLEYQPGEEEFGYTVTSVVGEKLLWATSKM